MLGSRLPSALFGPTSRRFSTIPVSRTITYLSTHKRCRLSKSVVLNIQLNNRLYLLKKTHTRLYTSEIYDRLSRAPKSQNVKNIYANRPRGDLSEYNHTIHGLSSMLGNRNLEVLKAWDRGDFIAVLDHCDDEIEARSGDLELATDGMSGEEKARLAKSSNLYLFHRNVKAAALNHLGRYNDALRVTEETLGRRSSGLDRDALCLKGVALNALGTIESNKNKDMEALESFQQALQLVPEGGYDLECKLNVATMLFKIGRANEAADLLNKALNYRVVSESTPESDYHPRMITMLNDASNNDAQALTPDDRQSSTKNIAPRDNGSAYHANLSATAQEDPFADIDANSNDSFENDPQYYRQISLDREHVKYDPDMRVLLAAIYVSTAQYEAAIAECQAGVQDLKNKDALESPLLSKFYEIQLSCTLRLGRLAEAELLAKMLVRLSPQNVETMETYFQLMMKLKRSYNHILASVHEAEKRFAANAHALSQVLFMRLLVQHEFKLPGDALRTCDEILQLTHHELTYILKSLILYESEQYLLAVDTCDKALRSGVEHADIHLIKALSYESLQKFDAAMEIYDERIASDPKFIPGHYYKARALARLGKHDQALASYDRALEEPSPAQISILLAKASLLRGLGRLKDSLDCYAEAAKINPKLGRELASLANDFQRSKPSEFMSAEMKARADKMSAQLQQLGGGMLGLGSSLRKGAFSIPNVPITHSQNKFAPEKKPL